MLYNNLTRYGHVVQLVGVSSVGDVANMLCWQHVANMFVNRSLALNGKTCFSVISFATFLDEFRILMAVSSSRMLPSDVDRISKILPSMFLSCRLLSAPCIMSEFFSSSSSGRSRATTMPSSWSCKPSSVIIKFNSVTCNDKQVN